ncbi:hypothetical protein DN402_31865 [Streptomyces sp. SW4]|nr:hypothetical protein DN402_31865 [Streptomyces sp. SW4]
MTTTPLPASTPRPAGHEWDVIRAPRQLGLAAMSILGTRAGAVVEDPQRASVFFFVPAGAAASWRVQNTEPLPEGRTVPLPPRRRTEGPGPHWRICPGDGSWLTDPAALAAALSDAFGPRLGKEQAG